MSAIDFAKIGKLLFEISCLLFFFTHTDIQTDRVHNQRPTEVHNNDCKRFHHHSELSQKKCYI